MTIQGIDVSNYQGKIDWAAVAASGVTFAYIHCTDGFSVDPWFATNWAGAKTAGIVRGAYAYVYPQLHQAAACAQFFVTTLAPVLEDGDFAVGDFEEGSGDQSIWSLTWLRTVESGLTFKPLIYSRLNLLEEYNLASNADIGTYGLAIASWGATTPTLPPAWTVWAIWQYSAHGAVPGIAGAVDLDEFNGTADQLRSYGLQPKPTPAPKQMTNDDLIAAERYLLAQPPDIAGLLTYVQPFAGGS